MGFVQKVRNEGFRVLTDVTMHVKCNVENIHKLWSVKYREWVFIVKEMELEGLYKRNMWKAS